MQFSSLEFIFRFLPLFFLCYFVMPERGRNVVLLLGSLVFYAVSGPIYVILMVASIVINFLLARLIEYYDGKDMGEMTEILGVNTIRVPARTTIILVAE